MEKTGLREKALKAIDDTKWYPKSGKNRITAMIADRPDWVISRQRAWGVPITVFVHKETGEILQDTAVNDRIVAAVKESGADAWVAIPAQEFLGDAYNAGDYEQVSDILDVWFDSGCTHAFVLEGREDLTSPADLYLEGTDQHRGWFQSSLLESCGTRGHAPYKAVLTHGFTMDAEGRKMSKSLGNTVAPQKIIQQYGADILRLWVVAVDYTSDNRIGDEIIKGQADAYRKIRNTMRYMLGNLAGFSDAEKMPVADMPELERWVLHRLSELDALVRTHTNIYDFNPIYRELFDFCNYELSAIFFDIRRDAFYCDSADSDRRRAARTVLDEVFQRIVLWFAPVLSFTTEEVWQSRYGEGAESVHRQLWPETPQSWRDQALADKWAKVLEVRSLVTGELELHRKEGTIGSSLQASVNVAVDDDAMFKSFDGLDAAEIFITSAAEIQHVKQDGKALSVEFSVAEGEKCERCWVISPEVTTHGDLCGRCQDVVAAYDRAAAE